MSQPPNTKSELVRINKYLADRNLCSRREADQLIAQGLIRVNGKTLTEPGYKVKKGDKVEVTAQAKKLLDQKLTLILHKPLGYVSAQAEDGYKPAIRLVVAKNFAGPGRPPRIEFDGFAPAGRLDIDSTGLLILTQDGVLAKRIIGANSKVEKEYLVKVEGAISQAKVSKLSHGLSLDGRALKPAKIEKTGPQQLRFVLNEGRKRQIRRMCELVDLKVTALKRVRIGRLTLGKLPPGCWRILKPDESID